MNLAKLLPYFVLCTHKNENKWKWNEGGERGKEGSRIAQLCQPGAASCLLQSKEICQPRRGKREGMGQGKSEKYAKGNARGRGTAQRKEGEVKEKGPRSL